MVEQATDILPLEKTSAFRGRYHSLGGRISPLDHVGPENLRIKELIERIEKENFSEIIFALAADVEGEATTNYLVEMLKGKQVNLTRIAHGLPAGGGLESADELTPTKRCLGEQSCNCCSLDDRTRNNRVTGDARALGLVYFEFCSAHRQ